MRTWRNHERSTSDFVSSVLKWRTCTDVKHSAYIQVPIRAASRCFWSRRCVLKAMVKAGSSFDWRTFAMLGRRIHSYPASTTKMNSQWTMRKDWRHRLSLRRICSLWRLATRKGHRLQTWNWQEASLCYGAYSRKKRRSDRYQSSSSLNTIMYSDLWFRNVFIWYLYVFDYTSWFQCLRGRCKSATAHSTLCVLTFSCNYSVSRLFSWSLSFRRCT